MKSPIQRKKRGLLCLLVGIALATLPIAYLSAQDYYACIPGSSGWCVPAYFPNDGMMCTSGPFHNCSGDVSTPIYPE
ncbi:hypothetical protein SAMN05421740_107201 [Parapedobacter koreensis]|uniref:Uncharacterized protein n=1 Tax=Parapedobacter koreensis TaxID=332977 RepID=A0A1H7RPW6_9SPHI|nr:hypothetical protein SAMN05421740_107201 [Parapedobacter koreensis]